MKTCINFGDNFKEKLPKATFFTIATKLWLFTFVHYTERWIKSKALSFKFELEWHSKSHDIGKR